MMDVSLHELDSINPQPPCRRLSEREGLPTEVRCNDDAVTTRKVKAHLAGATTNLHDAGVIRNCCIQQTSKSAALGARPQPFNTILGRITGKGRRSVEGPYPLDAIIRRQAQTDDAVDILINRLTALAA